MTSKPMNSICSPAWILKGVTRSEPAMLQLRNGRLVLVTAENVVFDTPLSEVREINFPWYYFGGGVKLKVGSQAYRLSFVQPNDADDLSARLLARSDGLIDAATGLETAVSDGASVVDGRKAGKAWRAALG